MLATSRGRIRAWPGARKCGGTKANSGGWRGCGSRTDHARRSSGSTRPTRTVNRLRVGVHAGWRTLATVDPNNPSTWLALLDETFFERKPQPRAVRHRPRRPKRHRPPYPHPGHRRPPAANHHRGRNHILWTCAPTHRSASDMPTAGKRPPSRCGRIRACCCTPMAHRTAPTRPTRPALAGAGPARLHRRALGP